MATPQPQQPLVCASLHLPPDPQPFLRIREISLLIFLPNLDRLRRDVEATQETNPEATESFYETRIVLRGELHKVFGVLQLVQEVAKRYLKILEALEQKKPTRDALYQVNLGAYAGMECSKDGQKAMSVFRREFEKAVERVTNTTGASKSKRGRKSSLTSAKNIQSVSEILTAITECNGLLQQCHDQFVQLAKQAENRDSIDSDPPSDEETQVMRAKWQTFFDSVEGVWRQGFEIANEIVTPLSYRPQDTSGSYKPRQNVPLWRTLFQRQDKRDLVCSGNILEAPKGPTDQIAAAATLNSSHETPRSMVNTVGVTQGLEALADTTVPGPAPSNGRIASKSKISFWRKAFQRVNNSSPRDLSERFEASDNEPDTAVPQPKVTFGRKFFPCATCLSTAPFR